MVRGCGGDKNEVDSLKGLGVIGLHASTGSHGKIRCGFTRGTDMTFADTGSFPDPFVRGLNKLLEINVGQDSSGKSASGSGYAYGLDGRLLATPPQAMAD